MNYWRFIQITKVAHKIQMIESGHPYSIEDGKLPESTKDLIKRKKEQNKREAGLGKKHV